MQSGQNWPDYEKAAEQGPLALAVKMVIGIFLLGIVISVIGYPLGWFSSAAKVAKQEFGPEAAMQKYGWFKDAAAQLDKKRADIQVYEGRIKAMDETYKSTPRTKWAREDREQYNIWSSEVAGVKAGYNSLAAEYNANMAKFNWRFANIGDVPQGARPLPRDFPEYTNK